MSTAAWITFGICCASLWAGLIKEVFIPLYKQWRWTRAHRYETEPSPLALHYAENQERKQRTYQRLGIRELPGKTRVGRDTRTDGLR